MNTYLFAWNPDKWKWNTLLEDIVTIKENGYVTRVWSAANSNMRPGDRAYLIKLGDEPRGIIASGYISSYRKLLPHYREDGTLIMRVHIDFDILLDPLKPILSIEALKVGITSQQHWSPQSSGILIQPEVVLRLESLWYNFLADTDEVNEPPEESSANDYKEGESKVVSFTRYQRNRYARVKCIEHYGYDCYICGFNFERTYGGIGAKYIHVHHLTPLSHIGEPYNVDPLEDLRPVCPNCHAILHKADPPLSMDEMKNQIANTILKKVP